MGLVDCSSRRLCWIFHRWLLDCQVGERKAMTGRIRKEVGKVCGMPLFVDSDVPPGTFEIRDDKGIQRRVALPAKKVISFSQFCKNADIKWKPTNGMYWIVNPEGELCAVFTEAENWHFLNAQGRSVADELVAKGVVCYMYANGEIRKIRPK